MSRTKKRENNIDSCIEVAEEIPKCRSKYSNLVEKHGISGLTTNYGSLLHYWRIPVFLNHAIYIQHVYQGESFGARTIKCVKMVK